MNFRLTSLLFFLALSLNLLVWSGAAAVQEQGACLSPGWPSERSDLQPDPSLVRGTLKNGLRYAVMENHEPEHRVALYLYVHAGSLNERPEERGVAHFLEHMLFNGTTHFQPGELVKFFQDIGMSFGGDTNAHTTYEQTVYNLILPNGSGDDLRKGFLVMSDYARGALLLEKEVERERRVILSEKRSRDSAGYRAYVKASEFRYRGTLLPERQVIGEESVLTRADQALLKGFYDHWYRPENMLLVVVGDIRPETVEPLITEFFSPLRGASDQPACPEVGRLDHAGLELFYHHEQELGRTQVSIDTVWNDQPVDDSRQLQTEELYRYASIMMLTNRLRKLQERHGDVLTWAGYDAGDTLQHIRSSSIAAGTSAEKWPETLELLEHTLRQALRYGFQQNEVERAKKDILSALDTAVLTAKSRDSEALAREIIRQFGDNRVFQSPMQERELYATILSKMGAEEVNQVFRADWSADNRLVSVQGDAVISGDNPEQRLREMFTKLSASEVSPYSEEMVGGFPYLKVPEVDGKAVRESTKLTAVDAERLLFANNVAVTLKRTDFEPNTVKIVVDVGQGKLSEPVVGLSLLGDEVVNDSGTGALTAAALSDALSGRTVSMNFDVAEESFRWSGRAVTKESELLLQLVYHLLQDPGLREQAYVRAQSTLKQMYDSIESDIQGAVRTKVDRFLAGGDPRIGLPPRAEVAALTLDQLRRWLLPQFRHGSMEVAIVGDFQPEQMKALALKYFGALPERAVIAGESSSLTFPAGKSLETQVNSSVQKSLVIAAWPTGGFWDIQRTRRLHMLAEILEDRLRLEIREKLGATYSPAVMNLPSRVYGDYGKLLVQVVVAPGREQEILKVILRIADQLRAGGISPVELDRAKGPIITSLKDTVRTNEYWMNNVLAGSMRHPQQLAWPATLFGDFSEITVEEMGTLAASYLVPEKMANAVVKPTGTTPR